MNHDEKIKEKKIFLLTLHNNGHKREELLRRKEGSEGRRRLVADETFTNYSGASGGTYVVSRSPEVSRYKTFATLTLT